MKSHKRQTPKPNFKIDEIVLVLIVAFLAIIISIYNKANETKGIEAEKITAMVLDDNELSFASNGIIDGNKLKEIQSINYRDFKKSLNVKNDFCIYLEDENGHIILTKGASKLNKDGLVCRE